jgi:regulation of enolase protein 1 (concanavalin A-like superfamily)
MLRTAVAFAFVAVPLLAVAAPVPKDDNAARLARTYGIKADPARDASFDLTGDVLRIIIPKRELTARALGRLGGEPPNIDPAAAPRVWREVQDDFTATVRVTFPLTFAKAKAESGVRAAGLVVWASQKEHLFLARVEWVSGKAKESFYLRYTSETGRASECDNQDSVANSGFVRLECRGGTISGGYSRDGKEWTPFLFEKALKTTAPLKVGVFATHATDDPFEAVFDQYTLTVPKK